MWPKALRWVAFVYNRTLTKSTQSDVRGMIPYELSTEMKPDLLSLRIFREPVKVLKPRLYQKGKVNAYVWDGSHVGYAPGDAYSAYMSELDRVSGSKDVKFIEKLYRRMSTASLDMDDHADDESITADDRREDQGVTDNDEDTKEEAVEKDNNGNDVCGTPHEDSKRLPWISVNMMMTMVMSVSEIIRCVLIRKMKGKDDESKARILLLDTVNVRAWASSQWKP